MEPTSFDELSTEWGFDSTREAKNYARSKMQDYYDIGSLGIISTDEAEKLVDSDITVDPGIDSPSQTTTQTEKNSEEDTEADTKQDDDSDVPHREQLINELQRISSEVGGLPSQTDLREKGNYGSWEYTYEFGSLENAYKAAEMDIQRELLDEIERLSVELGKEPELSEVVENGRYSRQRYNKHFRNWSQALSKAEINNDSQETEGQETDDTPDQSSNNRDPSQEPNEDAEEGQDFNQEEGEGDEDLVDKIKSLFE
jgi:hypothetical protein